MEAILRELLGSGGLDSSYYSSSSSSSSSSSHSQYVKTKRVLQQTRQLLFDCVREAIEKYQTGTGRRRRLGHGGVAHHHQFIGPEKLGKIICDEIRAWGKQSVNISNFNEMVEADISETTTTTTTTEEEGWSGFLKPHSIRKEIGMGIADAILEEMSNEIVSDMIHHSHLRIQ